MILIFNFPSKGALISSGATGEERAAADDFETIYDLSLIPLVISKYQLYSTPLYDKTTTRLPKRKILKTTIPRLRLFWRL